MQAQLNGLLMGFLLRDSRPSQTVLAARCRQNNVARSSLSMCGVLKDTPHKCAIQSYAAFQVIDDNFAASESSYRFARPPAPGRARRQQRSAALSTTAAQAT